MDSWHRSHTVCDNNTTFSWDLPCEEQLCQNAECFSGNFVVHWIRKTVFAYLFKICARISVSESCHCYQIFKRVLQFLSLWQLADILMISSSITLPTRSPGRLSQSTRHRSHFRTGLDSAHHHHLCLAPLGEQPVLHDVMLGHYCSTTCNACQ